MRYYSLTLTDPNTGKVVKTWESHPNNVFDPQAQNIQFDIPITAMETPIGGQTITVEGVALADLTQAQQYTGLNFSLKGGMKKGLPLANPLQNGLLCYGVILQSFGNWEGTEMTLDFVVYPSEYSHLNAGNIVLNWPVNTPLSDALMLTLNNGFPGVNVNMNIAKNLITTNDEVGYYPALEGLAQHILEYTTALKNPVHIVFQNNEIMVYDDTHAPAAKQLNFNDLVGQPTWIAVDVMQIKLVQRGDLSIGSRITMPDGTQNAPGFVTSTQLSKPSNMKYKTTFAGEFVITEMRHLGNYRAPDGASWVTIMNCAGLTNG